MLLEEEMDAPPPRALAPTSSPAPPRALARIPIHSPRGSEDNFRGEATSELAEPVQLAVEVPAQTVRRTVFTMMPRVPSSIAHVGPEGPLPSEVPKLLPGTDNGAARCGVAPDNSGAIVEGHVYAPPFRRGGTCRPVIRSTGEASGTGPGRRSTLGHCTFHPLSLPR